MSAGVYKDAVPVFHRDDATAKSRLGSCLSVVGPCPEYQHQKEPFIRCSDKTKESVTQCMGGSIIVETNLLTSNGFVFVLSHESDVWRMKNKQKQAKPTLSKSK
ncbi:hypothetical protein ElyMa_000112500 [Elysia marginata]|uniref:Uncharacterized protein n=1 Tax=Elysia marginata TaxID=1093978 RepID=A0AAV4ELS6_9GAST|nr:hypothetical protein ElyMa_000112500 [Elysia marginata]